LAQRIEESCAEKSLKEGLSKLTDHGNVKRKGDLKIPTRRGNVNWKSRGLSVRKFRKGGFAVWGHKDHRTPGSKRN